MEDFYICQFLVTPLERQSRRAPLPTKACQYHRTIRPLRSQVLVSSKGAEMRKKAFLTLAAILSPAYTGRGSTMSGQMADFERVAHK